MFNIIEVNGGTLRITTAFSFYLKKMNIVCTLWKNITSKQ